MPARAQVLIDPWAVRAESPDGEGQGTWLDRTQRGWHDLLARTARTIDGWAGPPLEPEVYEEASGSIGLALLWDEYHGFDAKLRFRVDLPLPQINERLHFFVGRLDRDEFVTERERPSGGFPEWRRGEMDDDQTLAGFIYFRPGDHDLDFSASAGARVHSGALDPYVKTSLAYHRPLGPDALLVIKETLFYQLSEQFGLTTRVDYERILGESWWLRWRGSATISEGTKGVRGFSTLTAVRGLPDRQALAFRVGFEADSAAPVRLEDFGVEVAYRRAVFRDWLVLEWRTSLTWPQEDPAAARKPSWGFGMGCEMYFGDEEFSIQPVTF